MAKTINRLYSKYPFELTGKVISHAPVVWSAYGPERGRKPRRTIWESTPEEILAHKDIHKGEKCCLIANGPSVRTIDLSKIDCTTIGLNQAWKLRECDYYCLGDQAQIQEYEQERGPIEQLKPLFATHAGPEHAIRVRGLLAPIKQFSFDLTEGVHLNNTITAYGIQLAIWMGFSTIYIVGLDLRGDHFWGGAPIPEKNFANHRETFGYISGLLEGMKYPVEIINLNPASICFAFHRVPYEEVFN